MTDEVVDLIIGFSYILLEKKYNTLYLPVLHTLGKIEITTVIEAAVTE